MQFESRRLVALVILLLSQPASAQKLYWLEHGKIHSSNLDGKYAKDFYIARVTSPNGVAIDQVNEKLYWSDLSSGKIQRSNLDGSMLEDVVTGTPSTVQIPIALDILNSKVYWSRLSNKIWVAGLDGSDQEIFLDGLPGDVGGIVVDPDMQLIYWTEFGQNKAIRRANLNRSEVQDVVSNLSYWPLGIALDPQAAKLYWTTTWDGPGIVRANLDGTGIIGLNSSPDSPWGLTLDLENGKMYWTDNWYGTVERANLDGTGRQVLTGTQVFEPSGIAVGVHTGLLFWAQNGKLESSALDGTERRTLLQGILASPFDIAFDNVHGELYWADSVTDSICRMDLGGGSARIIAQIQLSTPTGFTIDAANSLVFWTARNHGTPPTISAKLYRATTEGLNITALGGSSALDPCAARFRGVAVDESEGSIFYVDDFNCDDWLKRWGQNSITSTPGFIRDVLVDQDSLTVYWCQSSPELIGHSDYAGTSPEPLILLGTRGAISIALDEELHKIYWLEGPQPYRIMRADIDGQNIEEIFSPIPGAPRSLSIDLRWLGDYDRDRDVDLIDVAAFQNCLIEDQLSAGCQSLDFDSKDGRVDLIDFAQFVVSLEELRLGDP